MPTVALAMATCKTSDPRSQTPDHLHGPVPAVDQQAVGSESHDLFSVTCTSTTSGDKKGRPEPRKTAFQFSSCHGPFRLWDEH